jgi:hypothetical protein
MLFFFHHAENFDARTRERHLNDVFNEGRIPSLAK